MALLHSIVVVIVVIMHTTIIHNIACTIENQAKQGNLISCSCIVVVIVVILHTTIINNKR